MERDEVEEGSDEVKVEQPGSQPELELAGHEDEGLARPVLEVEAALGVEVPGGDGEGVGAGAQTSRVPPVTVRVRSSCNILGGGDDTSGSFYHFPSLFYVEERSVKTRKCVPLPCSSCMISLC